MVTDTVYLATEDIVWEALWDQARKLKKRQMEELEREMGRKKHVDSHMLSLLRDNYTEPLNSHLGASIVNKKWSELLYHTNRYMQRGSLMENYAIRKLQEQIICQVFDLPSQHCNTPVACCRPATKLSRRAHRRRLTRLQCAIIHCLSHHAQKQM